jgi:hypothetical protein
MKKALIFFLLVFCFFSCSDYRSGINVVNESSEKTEFRIYVRTAIWEYSDKKTLEPNEIWKFGFAYESTGKRIIEGDYSVSTGTAWISVKVKRDNEYIVKWDGTGFRLEQ